MSPGAVRHRSLTQAYAHRHSVGVNRQVQFAVQPLLYVLWLDSLPGLPICGDGPSVAELGCAIERQAPDMRG